jgi:CCR4-NOT complex subunit CAF16
MAQSTDPQEPSIAVQNLSYKFQDGSAGLENVKLDLPPGSRTLLIGGNTQDVPCHRGDC